MTFKTEEILEDFFVVLNYSKKTTTTKFTNFCPGLQKVVKSKLVRQNASIYLIRPLLEARAEIRDFFVFLNELNTSKIFLILPDLKQQHVHTELTLKSLIRQL